MPVPSNEEMEYSMKNKKNHEAQIFQSPPEGFDSSIHVASSYVLVDGKLLLLQLSQQKHEPGCWGVPAGKMESHETPENAAKRELFEETGISLDANAHMQSLGRLYVRKPQNDYVYHMFKVELTQVPQVHLSDEHQNHIWIAPEEAKILPIMTGGRDALKLGLLAQKSKGKRSATSINAYLILRHEDKVLLMLRQNTGYGDGFYCVPSGHVEDGESASTGLIREAWEEVGVEINPSDLKMVHVVHARSNRQNVDFFFECSSWKGTIANREPDKCAEVSWYPINGLPSNIVVQVAQALRAVERGEYYSELGW